MKLLSVETLQEQLCLADLNISLWLAFCRVISQTAYFSEDLKVKNVSFWTSATNEGYGCDVKHGWCGSRTLIMPNLTWRAGDPNGFKTEKCVEVNFNQENITYNDLPCFVNRFFICEVNNFFTRIIFMFIISLTYFKADVPPCMPTCPVCEKNVRDNNSVFSATCYSCLLLFAEL
jgi:hypothetical protein